MAVFKSALLTGDNLDELGQKGTALLKQIGAVLPENFKCIGMPWICLEDFTKDDGEQFDFDFYKGRIVLGGNLDNSDNASFPSGPVRLTVGRMTHDPNDAGKIVVGKTDLNHTSILSFVGITIGDNVHLDPRVVIQDCDGHQADRRLPDTVENKRRAPIVIEDDVWIGYGATILKGVTVGHHAVVHPGAVVMWDVPAYGVVAGNPAKSIKVYKNYMQPKAEQKQDRQGPE
jgi:hypothetical protein